MIEDSFERERRYGFYFVSVESASGSKEFFNHSSKLIESPKSPKDFPIPLYTLSFNNKSSIFFGSTRLSTQERSVPLLPPLSKI